MIEINKNEKYAVALGFFDGLHKGHMAVLNETLKYACKGLTPAVILFDEHPRKVLFGDDVPLLLQREKRDEMLRKMGFQCIYVPFRDIMNMSPEEFVDEILIKKVNARALVCGYNYRFGKASSGDSRLLTLICEKRSIPVSVASEYISDNTAVSSTKIRSAVEKGDITQANALLGYEFSFSSAVFSGDKRGRTLGTPTINQYFPENLIVPRYGVYASRVFIESREYKGVTNIGCRPTFDGKNARSETYIMDYNGDLYGRVIEISLVKFIREEKKFPDAPSLIRQINEDVERTKEFFSENP